jgi:hypothetical protein
MLPSRPLVWAKGTHLQPGWDNNGRIIIQIEIDSQDDMDTYEHLVTWMSYHVYSGITRRLDAKNANLFWDHVSRYE